MNTIATMRALDEKRGAVRVEDVYDTDIDDLWNACTAPERLARWIAEVAGDIRVGGTVHAAFTSTWTGPVRIDWQAHLEDLGRSLAGRSSAWKSRWTELTPVYESMPIT
jgi:Activator of Hsp90 ATPase homolog 1-like protein